jgi:hypothetical protein
MSQKQRNQLAINTDVIISTFSLSKFFGGEPLETWFAGQFVLTATQQELFETIYKRAIHRIGGWNEEELKMKFISILLLIADIEEDGQICTFFERNMAATIEKYYISVKTDCLIATPLGYNTPKRPYFFLQEYKRQKGDRYDPEAQMLAAMLVAQAQNKDGKPIYGAWLTGSIWFFTVLIGKNYHTSSAFDTHQKEDLLKIIFILRNLKTLILNG